MLLHLVGPAARELGPHEGQQWSDIGPASRAVGDAGGGPEGLLGPCGVLVGGDGLAGEVADGGAQVGPPAGEPVQRRAAVEGDAGEKVARVAAQAHVITREAAQVGESLPEQGGADPLTLVGGVDEKR